MSGSALRRLRTLEKVRDAFYRKGPYDLNNTGNPLPDWARGGGGGGGGGDGGGDGGAGGLGGSPFGNGDWKLLTPNADAKCDAEMLEGFSWALANSDKLWSLGESDWNEEYAKTGCATMCEFQGAQIAAFYLRRLQQFEDWMLGELNSAERTRALMQRLQSEFASQQDEGGQARQRNTE